MSVVHDAVLCVCVCVRACVRMCVCVCAQWLRRLFFQFTADSHLLHLFITGLNAVTLSSCAVPQASLRSDGCVSALPPENPAHPNKGRREKKSRSEKKKSPRMQVGRKCLVVNLPKKNGFCVSNVGVPKRNGSVWDLRLISFLTTCCSYKRTYLQWWSTDTCPGLQHRMNSAVAGPCGCSCQCRRL